MSYFKRNQRRSRNGKRRLFAEQLEARRTLDGNDGDFYLDPPPPTYLDDNLAVEVSRLTWEFDEWNKADIARGPFVQSEDSRVSIADGKALLAFVAKEANSDALLAELRPLQVSVSASIDNHTSAWVPLASLSSLKDLAHASWVHFELLNSVMTQNFVSMAQSTPAAPMSELSLQEVESTAASESTASPPAASVGIPSESPTWSPRLSGTLQQIWQREQTVATARNPVASANADSIFAVEGDRVLILASSATHTGAQMAKRLTALGATVTAFNEQSANAWVPVALLPDVGQLPEVTFATAETRSVQMIGSTDSQGDALIRANEVRARFGFDGAGQTVGVISDSYNRLGGAAADIASGDLSTVTVVAESAAATNSDEGRAMLQIVRDVAPGANLQFATALGGQVAFSNNIQALFNAGSRIIVDDVLYLAEPMFQDGIIAQRVDIVTGQGATYVSSAGNFGTRSYETTGFANSNILRDYGRGMVPLMDFDPSGSVDAFQQITVPAGTAANIILQWQDTFRSVAPGSVGAQRDLDLLVYDAAATTVQFRSTTSVIGEDPIEIATIPAANVARTLNIAIGGVNFAGLGRVKYVITSTAVTIDQFATASPTAWGHTNATGTISVGASNALGSNAPPILQTYSSTGGIPIFFDRFGNLLAQPIVRQTPDVVGPDNVNTTFFGTDSALDSDTFPNFSGTSASAPHVAGLAALIRQARANATSNQVLTALTSTSLDMGTPGIDFQTGAGYVNGLSAVYSSFTPASAPDLTPASDSGISNSDNETNVAVPFFQGTAPAQSFVRLFINGSFNNSLQLGAGVTNYSISTIGALLSGNYVATVTFAADSNTAQSSSSAALSFTIDVTAPIFTGVLDLLSSADSGISNTDNITRLTPIFSASGAAPYLRLIGNSQIIANYISNSSSITTAAPPQGFNTYQLYALDAAGNVSVSFASLAVTFDTISPTVSLTVVSPDPRLNSISSFGFNFSETSLAGFDLSDVQLQRNSGANLLTTSQSLGLVSNVWTLSNLDTITAAVGDYALTLKTGTSGITDIAGNSLVNSGDLVETWKVITWQNPVLNVDVNASGQVTPLDALLVINFLNAFGAGSVVNNPNLPAAPPPYYDVNNDSLISPLDVLLVINYLNNQAAGLTGNRTSGVSSNATQTDPSVTIQLQATDLNGNPIQEVGLGQEFLITGSVQEAGGMTVLGAYLDVVLSKKLTVLSIESLSGKPTTLTNLGGLALESSNFDNSLQLFKIRVKALESGLASINATRPSSKFLDAAYVIGSDSAVDASNVKYGSLQLPISRKK